MDAQIKSPEELQKDFGKQMRALRIAHFLTQEELGARANVSPKVIRYLEAGGSTVKTLVRVLHALGETRGLETMVPKPGISPMAMLRSQHERSRVKHPKV